MKFAHAHNLVYLSYMKQIIFFAKLAALMFVCAPTNALAASTTTLRTTTQASSFKPKTAAGSNAINALYLRCKLTEQAYKTSFATVLNNLNIDGTQPSFDIAITTGHGLVGADGKFLKNCFVSYPGGKPLPIKGMKLAPNFKPGAPSDWAVLILPRVKNKHLVRYSVSDKLSQKAIATLAEKKPAVLFATARGIPVNGQHCTIEPRRDAGLKHDNFIGFLAHTCRAIAGQSGAPISVLQGHEPLLIGLHIGNSMVYGYPTIHTPLHYRGYMRGIDAEFMDQFSKLLASMQISDNK